MDQPEPGGAIARPNGAAITGQDVVEAPAPGQERVRVVTEPDKLVRITSMVRELLDETRPAAPDERGRVRLRETYERSLRELQEALPEALSEALATLAPPIEAVPTDAEIQVAHAQLEW